MRVASARRETHHLWLLAVFPILTPGLAVALTFLAATSDLPFPLDLTLFIFLPLLLYVALALLLVFTVGVRIVWHIQLANASDLQLQIFYFAPGVSPFDRYVILLNGREHGRQRGKMWRLKDRLEFRLGHHHATAIVEAVALGHRRLFTLTLDVDGDLLAVV